jgi:hypothetical protein
MAGGGRLRKKMEWRERLARFARAGTSVVEFCMDEGVSTPAFYIWRRRLAAEGGGSVLAEEIDALVKRHGPFAPVRVRGTAHGSSQVTVSLRGGTRLDISLADADAMRTVLEALVHADAQQAGGRPC